MAVNLITPRRREDFFDAQGEPTHRFIRWIESVTNQTNSSSIVIESTEQTLTSTGSRVSRNAARINSLELKEFETVTTTIDITTAEFQIIECTNTASIEVTLDTQAIKNDEVHIKRTDAAVTILGTIDGITDWILPDNWSLHLVFNGTEWRNI